MSQLKLPELVCPAGSLPALKAAIDDLNTKAASMGQAIYAAAQAKAQESAPAEDADAAGDDDVVEAEIVDEEKDDK